MKKYSVNWFNMENADYLNDIYRGKNDLKFLEIGSFEGYGTNYFIDNRLTGENCTITCIDPWIKLSDSSVTQTRKENLDHLVNENTYDIFLNNIQDNKDKVIIKRGLSRYILPTLIKEYDFIYVDGDHAEDAVFIDAILSFNITKVGGMILFDDYMWDNEVSRPKPAVDKFLSIYKDKIVLLRSNYQLLIKKIAD